MLKAVSKFFGTTVIVLILGLLLLSQAQNYPSYSDLFVNDYAKIISDVDTAQIRAQLETLRAETGIELSVVTFDSYKTYNTNDSSLESFSTNLFNDWGVGNAASNNGALILLSLTEREVRIELGSGYPASYNRVADLVIDEYMIPAFRQDNYSQGLLRGAEQLALRLSSPPPATTSSSSETTASSPPTSPSTPQPTRKPLLDRFMHTITDFDRFIPQSLVLSLFVFFTFGGRLRKTLNHKRLENKRYKARACQHCSTALILLDELSEDVYLDDGQKAEEYLNSVDYDVWKCPNCNEHELHRFVNEARYLKECPDCNYRTRSVHSKLLVAATCTLGGKKEITETCKRDSCDFHKVRIVTTPRRDCTKKTSAAFASSSSSRSFSSSSRSSSSSFGGGKSSGGGSSAKW